MNKLHKKYISQIKSAFPAIGKEEKKYLKTLSDDIKIYCEDNNPSSIEELYDNCGLPLDTVQDYYNQFEPDELITKLNLSVITKRFSLCVVTLLLICTIATFISSYYIQQATINELKVLTSEPTRVEE